MIKGKHILITGGTGSFGQRVAARLVEQDPASIRVFSRDEKKQYEMRKKFRDFTYLLGDVRDADRVNEALRGVDIVFHAAALKQVPSCEIWPEEALKTNTLGALNVCAAAVRNSVQRVVALSTDKAVKPVNAMGISKAMMERIVCAYSEKQDVTIFSCVRYGNVIGSRGSVIPLFRRQISRGGPVTVTEAEMTRFLLTLDEAVNLVFFAFAQARGGEIFVRRAPACRVGFLAQTMIKKYGGARHIPVVRSGIRPGEKIHEVLVSEYEMYRAKEESEFLIIPKASHDATQFQGKPVQWEYTSENTTQITQESELAKLLDEAHCDEVE